MSRKRTPKWLQAARASDAGFAPGEKPDWLTRALARSGHMPQAEAQVAIRAGRVSKNGEVVREPMAVVRAGDEIRLDGRRLALQAATRVLLFHKPAGVVTSTVDPEGGGTVFERLAAVLPPGLERYGWHAVGRLDRNTTGLLLFTNDERFVAHATRPESHLPKRYLALVQGRVDDERLEPLRRGITLDDGPTRPAVAVARGPGEVELTITEGRNHQVKRMLAAVGLPVRALHREAVGELVLDVPEGQVRELAPDEIASRLGWRQES
ncbi:pseudouridine synthase [Vulgatibacter sp.]|uniref:pseudouridine synthase n=1 Tax=Vulgatibacter sp. TaxID=1971226 RepID=UPI003564C0D8